MIAKIVRRLFGFIKSRKLGEMLEADFWLRADVPDYKLDPNMPLQEKFFDMLPYGKNVTILDVGAGMITTVGKKHSKNIYLVPIDPLADRYDKILKKRGLNPPVRTGNVPLSNLMGKCADIVYARNSIDHAEDPIKEINNMIRVCRGWVFMEHFVNTGEKEKYIGLHQWNFNKGENGELVVWNKKESHSIYHPYMTNEIVEENGKTWIITKINCKES